MGINLDSLDSIEAMMALEELLEGRLIDRLPELRPYLVEPFMLKCVRGSLAVHVCVFARFGVSAMFAAFETAKYGVGEIAENGEIHDSQHYQTLELASRAFLGKIGRKRAA